MKAWSLAAAVALCVVGGCVHAPAPEPLRVLIVSGGGYHDYPARRAILEAGLEARLNVEVAHAFRDIAPGEPPTRPALPIFANPRYGQGYDLIIHEECAADVDDPAVLDAVLAPHRAGVPAVNLHCAMHSYRSGSWRAPAAAGAANARWFAFVGVQSTGHGPQAPIALSIAQPVHPIARGLSPWVTPREELYNNLTDFGVTPILTGTQAAGPGGSGGGGPYAVAWTHQYGPAKARVFSVTLAHNTAVVADPRYLDLVARGVAWATGHLKPDGTLDAAIRPASPPAR